MAILNCFPAGGGAKLNVKAYSAVGGLPASDKAGAAAVITALPVGSGFASAAAPASPASGDVWIWLGGTSLAPIHLSGGVTLHPRAAYRYSGSAWVLLPCYVYTGSAWVEVTLSLYDNGAFILEPGVELILGDTLTLQAVRIYMFDSAGRGETSFIRVYFANSIDLTNVTTVKMILDWATANTSSGHYVKLEIGSNKTGTVVASAQAGTPGTGITLSVNVSALDGSYYIGAYVYGPPAGSDSYPSNTVYIQKVYLEK